MAKRDMSKHVVGATSGATLAKRGDKTSVTVPAGESVRLKRGGRYIFTNTKTGTTETAKPVEDTTYRNDGEDTTVIDVAADGADSDAKQADDKKTDFALPFGELPPPPTLEDLGIKDSTSFLVMLPIIPFLVVQYYAKKFQEQQEKK